MKDVANWATLIIVVSAVVGIFIKLILLDRRLKSGNCESSNPADTPVATSMCEQVQRNVFGEIKHVREILTRVEKNQDEKHTLLKSHIDTGLEQVKTLIKNGNRK